MTLHQFLLILRARYWVVLLAFGITVATTVVISLLLPKQYTASTAVVLDVKSPDPVTGMVLQGMMTPAYMATQIDIINSDRVAKAVVKLLKMDSSPAIRKQWQEETKGKGQLIDWLSELIQKKLDVKPSRESNVINIHYTGADPEFAATLANAFAHAYIEVNLDLRLAPARQYAIFFEEQTKAAREKLETAQQALSSYQQKHGITSIDERMDFESAKLSETSSQLTGVQGQTTDSQSKRGTARTDTLAEVIQNPLINSLKADIARLQAKIQENSVNLGANHPQTIRLETELTALQTKLNDEIRKINESIDTTYRVGKQREQQLHGALQTQKNKVLQLNKQRDELNVLRRDVESAQRAYEVVSQRAAQTQIESKTDQTNISILNPAVAPTTPSKPRVFLNILLSIFLGTLFGLGCALLLELANRRVRSTQDLVSIHDLPLLGTIANASNLIKSTGVRQP